MDFIRGFGRKSNNLNWFSSSKSILSLSSSIIFFIIFTMSFLFFIRIVTSFRSSILVLWKKPQQDRKNFSFSEKEGFKPLSISEKYSSRWFSFFSFSLIFLLLKIILVFEEGFCNFSDFFSPCILHLWSCKCYLRSFHWMKNLPRVGNQGAYNQKHLQYPSLEIILKLFYFEIL